MASILSLNQIYSILEDISVRHYQIQSFGIGRTENFDITGDMVNPIMWITPVSGTIFKSTQSDSYPVKELTLEIRILDLVNTSSDNLNDVHSDCHQILCDVVTEINQNVYFQNSDIQLEGNINLSPLEEWSDNDASGWLSTISFRMKNAIDYCNLPFASVDLIAYPGYSNSGITYSSAGLLTCSNVTGCTTLQNYITNTINNALIAPTTNVDLIHNLNTGLISGGTVSINSLDSTKFDVAAGYGLIVDNWTNVMSPTLTYVNFVGGTGLTVTNLTSETITHLSIDSSGNIIQSIAEESNQFRRENIMIGLLNHYTKVNISFALENVDTLFSPLSQYRDLMASLEFISRGNIISANGANLKINKSAGTLFGQGINYYSNQKDPHNKSISATTQSQFKYKTQTGWVSPSYITDIDPLNYDLSGTVTAIGGGANRASNQRVFLMQNGELRIQYGQTHYSNLAAAIQGLNSENFIIDKNLDEIGILIGILSVQKKCSVLTDTSTCAFIPVTIFGQNIGGNAGFSTTTLQQAYDNSPTHDILTNSTLGAVTIQNGAGSDTNNIWEGYSSGGTLTSYIKGDGSSSFGGAGFTGWTSSTGVNSIITNNSSGNKASAATSLAAGWANTATTVNSSVLGGSGNTINGTHSSIGGGQQNIIVSSDSFIGGGVVNSATGIRSVIGGGNNNIISLGPNSFIGGGSLNSTLYSYAVIGGGKSNSSLDIATIIGGGESNTINIGCTHSALLGGKSNTISNSYGIIGGGLSNTITGSFGFIGGGFTNTASGSYSSIGGGKTNMTSGYLSVVVGGQQNTVTGSTSSIVGGRLNTINGDYSVIGGGYYNLVTSSFSSISGGKLNKNSGINSFIGGGLSNSATTTYTVVCGGIKNKATGIHSAIVGGSGNTASSDFTFVGGGSGNTASAFGSTIGGGESNTASGVRSVIVGGTLNAASGIRSFIGGGFTNITTGSYSTVGGGQGNNASGLRSVIAGGQSNAASNTVSFVGGGTSNRALGNSSVIGGGGANSATTSYSAVFGGRKNVASGIYSFIGNGSGNTASGISSAIIGGTGNTVSGRNSVIVGGGNINGTANDTVYIPNGRATGNFSAATYYSGSTELSLLFGAGGDGNDITRVGNGLNTYTGGTGNNPTVNISGLTINNINVSGVSLFNTLSGNSISAATFYSGSTDLSLLLGGGGGGTSGDLFSASTGTNSIIANNGSGNLASGSISFVIGFANTATTENSSILGGSGNTVSGGYSTIVGGKNNLASGINSFVGGGQYNLASGYILGYYSYGNSFVGGGKSNSATTKYSSVVGGNNNLASGFNSFIGGGANNISSNGFSFIGGGNNNSSTNGSSFVGAGSYNTASGQRSFVGGGKSNSANTTDSSVIGGQFNMSSGIISSILTGKKNIASGLYSAILNGSGNTSTGTASAIIGGTGNTVSGRNSVIVGGGNINGTANDTVYMPNGRAIGNFSAATYYSGSTELSLLFGAGGGTGTSANLWSASTGTNSIIANNGSGNLASGTDSIAGGYNNSATTEFASVVGGSGNTASGLHSIVGGGNRNIASGNFSSISAGILNTSSGVRSFIGGGTSNIASGSYSSIGGGQTNTTSGIRSFIGNGTTNVANGNHSLVVGGTLNRASGNHSSVLGGWANTASTTYSAVVNGKSNTVNGTASAIIGGTGNTISGYNSVIVGGANINGTANERVYVPDLQITTEKGLFISTGATNPTAGIVTLALGMATIATTKVTSSSLIFLTSQDGALLGSLNITTRIVGTSFTINTGNVGDVRNIAWFIIEPV